MATLINKLFGEPRVVYVKNEDGSLTPLGRPVEFTSLTENPETEEPWYLKPIKLSFIMPPLRHKERIKLLHLAGLIKERRTTYKTIKHNCAKRNENKDN